MSLLVYYLIITVALVISFTVMRFGFRKFVVDKSSWVYKGLAIAIATIFFVYYMLGKSGLESVVNLSQNSPISSQILTLISILLTWFIYAGTLLVALQPFFKIKTNVNLIKFLVLPITLLATIFLSTYLVGNTADALQKFSAIPILMSVNLGLILGYGLTLWTTSFKEKLSGKDVGRMFLNFGLMLLSIMPVYLLRAVFGNYNSTVQIIDLNIYHRIAIYGGFLLPLAIWFGLRNKNEETKHFAILYLSLATMFSYLIYNKFNTITSPIDWPLHLCNTAMLIMPITLIFKTEKLFYFTYFINVLGAFIAMAMPNYGTLNIFGSSLIRFWLNHYIAFFMPLLIVALGIYQRPKLKQFKYATIAFTAYFIFVLFINAWFTNYGSVDFFFLNSDFVVGKLGTWAENLRNITLSFKIGDLSFVFYPIYQLLFYLVYVGASVGMWYIYVLFYDFAETLIDISKRRKQIAKDEFLQQLKKNKKENKNMITTNTDAKLEIINFSKKYGGSKNFAVENANLTVEGGVIFGFLGPNGAGKSTIIKSIVGIQPLTEGQIKVAGFDVEKQGVEAKQVVGFVPDHYALYEKLTGREYVNYIADLYGVSKEERTNIIEKYVKDFNLENAFDNQIKTYSHGMKQKVTIMSALVHNPKLWILDEPLTGLDPTSIFQVKEAMKRHVEKGNIVFFSSHIIDVVEKLCDRIAIIQKGKIITELDLKTVGENFSLEEYYLESIGEKVLVHKASKTAPSKEATPKTSSKKPKSKKESN